MVHVTWIIKENGGKKYMAGIDGVTLFEGVLGLSVLIVVVDIREYCL